MEKVKVSKIKDLGFDDDFTLKLNMNRKLTRIIEMSKTFIRLSTLFTHA
jgi:hypothetical protein